MMCSLLACEVVCNEGPPHYSERRQSMPKFIAVHSFGPGLRDMLAQIGPDLLAALKETYPQVVWDGMHVQWDTGKAVCLWEAPDAETIKGLFEQMQTPYDDLYPVEWVTPHDIASGG
jgi:hypothetical protein